MTVLVNDVHSKLNATEVRSVVAPQSVEDIQCLFRNSTEQFSIAGARHAMGSQQFAAGITLIDLTKLSAVRNFDFDTGQITVEAGVTWPELQSLYENLQLKQGTIRWGYRQKQTGADKLTLGGAVSANIHGRGLTMAPLVEDIVALEVVVPSGEAVTCSRSERQELFRHCIGGYGMFGVVTAVTLQLSTRKVLRRTVRVLDIEEAIPAAQRRIADGYLYGDFQFDIDPLSPDFLTKGVFSGYYPVETPIPAEPPRELTAAHWHELLYLAHLNKQEAFRQYAQHYLGTDGQLYLSDSHQRSEYLDDYHATLDIRLGSSCVGSEMISELYVPPERLVDFLHAAGTLLVELQTPVIYGTIRLIAPDKETALPWAQARFACVIFNLHVDHTPQGISKIRHAFQGLIDLALERGGSFYLTYHRFARPDQLRKAYPMLPSFIATKYKVDPQFRLTSTWFQWLEASMSGNGSQFSQ